MNRPKRLQLVSSGSCGPSGPVEEAGSVGHNRLKLLLITGDGLALAVGYLSVILAVGFPASHGLLRSMGVVCSAVIIGLASMRSQGLFLARVSAVRVVELTRSTRAMTMLVAGMIVVDRVAHFGFRIRYIVFGALISWVLIVISRSIFRSWVAVRRSTCLVTVVLGVAAAAALVSLAIGLATGGERAYFGTDSLSLDFLLGVIAGALAHRGALAAPQIRRWLSRAAPVLLIGLVAVWILGPATTHWLFDGWLPVIAAAAALLIAGVTASTDTLGWLSHPVVVGVGRRSYSLYLVPVSYTHLRAHETVLDLVCRLLLEKKKNQEHMTTHTPPPEKKIR